MSISLQPVTDLRSLLDLEPVKPDAFLGTGPDLGWGRIYGGQVVAQGLILALQLLDLFNQLVLRRLARGDQGASGIGNRLGLFAFFQSLVHLSTHACHLFT